MAGRTQDRIAPSTPLGGAPVTLTPAASSLSAIAGSTRTVANWRLAVGKRRFERALDRIRRNHHVGDLLRRDELFELAVGHHLGLHIVVQNCCRAATARKAITTYHIVQDCLRSFGSMAPLPFADAEGRPNAAHKLIVCQCGSWTALSQINDGLCFGSEY